MDSWAGDLSSLHTKTSVAHVIHHHQQGAIPMESNQVKGQVKEAAGTAQRKFGEAVDSPSHQAKGLAKEVEGKTQKAVGKAQEAAEDAADDLRSDSSRHAPPPR
jgi:uncharacterized protein YjbJ (UPF0337 family)